MVQIPNKYVNLVERDGVAVTGGISGSDTASILVDSLQKGASLSSSGVIQVSVLPMTAYPL